jgi:hypothetical protein
MAKTAAIPDDPSRNGLPKLVRGELLRTCTTTAVSQDNEREFMTAYSILWLSKMRVAPKVSEHTSDHFLRCLLNLRRQS